jgi:hypothetical protein
MHQRTIWRRSRQLTARWTITSMEYCLRLMPVCNPFEWIHWFPFVHCIENQLLDSAFQILTTNYDKDGMQFVSTAEHKVFPFYAIQWHAEKPVLYAAWKSEFLSWFWISSEWNAKQTTPHDMNTVIANRYIADFFISEGVFSCHIELTWFSSHILSSQKCELFCGSEDWTSQSYLLLRLKPDGY